MKSVQTTASKVSASSAQVVGAAFVRGAGKRAYVAQVAAHTPTELIELERQGVSGAFISTIAARMHLSAAQVLALIGVPKATAARKTAPDAVFSGGSGYLALGLLRLLEIADDLAANSTAESSEAFDAGLWLGQWIERPQPALGGKKPAELLDTPTGIETVARLLGAIQSGAFQ
jgi:putative toxin-antitoxin system antitoxin component (TIGR02293 family)